MKNFISKKRIEKGYSQRQLAEICNFKYQALQRYENGSVMPSVQMALILDKALETTVEELFRLDDAQE